MESSGCINWHDAARQTLSLYNKLADRQSKELFVARVAYDISPDFDALMRILNASNLFPVETNSERSGWKSILKQIKAENKRLCLWGAGTIGHVFASALQHSEETDFVFCDKNKKGEVLGQIILSPEDLLSACEQYYVIITVSASEDILQFLNEHSFPDRQILYAFSIPSAKYAPDYFEFQELIPYQGSFVDGGSFDGKDSIRFSQLRRISGIYLFEPDPNNFSKCQANLASVGIDRVKFMQMGLSDKSGSATLFAEGTESSFLIVGDEESHISHMSCDNSKLLEVSVARLDDIVKDKIAMLKMDIEGAEFSALRGSERIICDDKPFLAISVYHRRGDLLAIMSYLSSLVPEYRYYLRHYDPGIYDTVLYAFLPKKNTSNGKEVLDYNIYGES